jgi:hypothetical protein
MADSFMSIFFNVQMNYVLKRGFVDVDFVKEGNCLNLATRSGFNMVEQVRFGNQELKLERKSEV